MLICICGKSGSGKSTISNYLVKEFNAIHIDIDKIGHKCHSDKNVKQKLINTFGTQILTHNTIDRKKLREIVFASEFGMKKLENITWNYMENEIDKLINSNKDKLIILDWLLLPKTKYLKQANLKILINTPYEVRKERILKRDNITERDFNLREQASINYDENDFDYIFNTNDIENIRKLVKL